MPHKMFEIMTDNIIEATDEEIIKEATEDGIDIKEEVLRIKSIFKGCQDNIKKQKDKE